MSSRCESGQPDSVQYCLDARKDGQRNISYDFVVGLDVGRSNGGCRSNGCSSNGCRYTGCRSNSCTARSCTTRSWSDSSTTARSPTVHQQRPVPSTHGSPHQTFHVVKVRLGWRVRSVYQRVRIHDRSAIVVAMFQSQYVSHFVQQHAPHTEFLRSETNTRANVERFTHVEV